MSPYPGGTLNEEDSFRLIEIHAGNHEDPLTISLLQCHLNDAPSYEALSYVWGDPTATVPIQIIGYHNTKNDQSPFYITVNCFAALTRLRYPTSRRTIWVDSICIDQSQVSERNHQLSLIPILHRRESDRLPRRRHATNRSSILHDTGPRRSQLRSRQR